MEPFADRIFALQNWLIAILFIIQLLLLGIGLYRLLFAKNKFRLPSKDALPLVMRKNMRSVSDTAGWLLLTLSIYFAFAGTVNLGLMGFLPTIPFFVFLVYASYDKRFSLFARPSLYIFTALFILKHVQTPVFFPANGKILNLNSDACLLKYNDRGRTFVMISSLNKDTKCDPSEPDVISKKIGKGSRFKVYETKVNNGWLMEKYSVVLKTSMGNLNYDPNSPEGDLFKWDNGKRVVEEDLYRSFFYSCSQDIWLFAKPFGFVLNKALDKTNSTY